MFLADTTPEEVCSIINSMDVSKSTGPSSIPTRLLKTSRQVLSSPLSTLINNSFKRGIFPRTLQMAKVIPIHKGGLVDMCSNYRPISLLSNISKIFERAMYTRVYNYLEKFDFIYSLQFGFRRHHSTTHALINLIEQVKGSLDEDKYTCGIFIDLQKAFDTVNHSILISKLDHYGIRGNVNAWLSTFLKHRMQFVSLENTDSSTLEVHYGVPLGSILGPLLFLIYINDLWRSVTQGMCQHFADDTVLLISHNSAKALRKLANTALIKVHDWICANRLSLNAKKTELLLFKPACKNRFIKFTLTLAGTKIFPSSKVSFLGVIIDSSLTWKAHISELSKKLNRAIGLLAKARHYVPALTLRSLYFSLFQNYLSYGCLVWGFSSNLYLQRLHLAQKRAIRLISFSDFREPTSELFAGLRILKVHDLIEYNRYLFMHDWLQGKLPIQLQSLFRLRVPVRKTRNINGCLLQRPKVKSYRFGSNSLRYVGANLINNLVSLHIAISPSKAIFKKHMFNLLSSKY